VVNRSQPIIAFSGWIQASAAVKMRPSFFWDFRSDYWYLFTDVSGQPAGPHLRGMFDPWIWDL